MVEFIDLKRSYERYAKEYEDAVLRALRSGWYILGNEGVAFENSFAHAMGAKYCVGVNSGLDALILAIRALEIGPGDEVIVPANTYIASVLGITENGATPVYVEPDEFFCLDAARIEAAITEKTRAILPVQFYGQTCNMAEICRIAEKYSLYVVEDCAQSHGAHFCGKNSGTFGTIGCFSFYPTKPLGACGDAGALLTNDPIIAEKLKKLRNYGSSIKYVHDLTGKNSRMDELQAALLSVGLSHLEEGNTYRRAIAARYLTEIRNPMVTLPLIRPGSDHVWHVFAVLCEKRDILQKYLLSKGIKTLIHYPIPPHLQECYRDQGYLPGSFPVAERYAAQELSLPIYVGMPDEEVTAVIEAINSFEVTL